MQKGYLYGVRGGYDHIKRFKFYGGIEGNYATGRIKGHTGGGSPISSQLTDAEIEIRGGYTLACKYSFKPSITPFIGFGYFCQKNNFSDPSPLHLHFRDTFKYVVAGFLSQFSPTPCLDVGIVFKAKYMIDGKSKVSHDPDFSSVTLRMEERTQYSVDLPITYLFSFCDQPLTASLEPFYQYRNYGGLENYPFNFIKTKFINFGARALLGYSF